MGVKENYLMQVLENGLNQLLFICYIHINAVEEVPLALEIAQSYHNHSRGASPTNRSILLLHQRNPKRGASRASLAHVSFEEGETWRGSGNWTSASSMNSSNSMSWSQTGNADRTGSHE
jgi:hypothetical protein